MSAPALAEQQRQEVLAALAKCNGNQSEAARLLGLNRNTYLGRLNAARAAPPAPAPPAPLLPLPLVSFWPAPPPPPPPP